MENISVDIFGYLDFKKYLHDAFNARARKETRFTKSYICRQVGMPNSRSFFTDVIGGKKPLSKSKVELLIPVFSLDAGEAQYFRFLVLYNQTLVKDEKEFYLDQIIALNRAPWKLVDKNAHDYYHEWYISAIRAYLDTAEVGDDHEKIARSLYPSIAPGEARKAMGLLKRLGFIKKNERGHWKPADQILFTPADANDAIIKRYQAKCIELSVSALYDGDVKLKSFATRTVSVSEDTRAKIKKKLDKFLTEVRSLVKNDESPAERIWQLNVQFFPQSQARA
jgi:uncharacterized protein (TIGR02147 family)